MQRRQALWVSVVLVLAAALPAGAWGPVAHAVVGMRVAEEMGLPAPTKYLLLQGVYGTGAPDFAWAAPASAVDALGAATHDDPGYLDPWLLADPTSAVEQVFAFGWLTHNQAWGADYFAHIGDPFSGVYPAPEPGYVIGRASALAGDQGISEGVAHIYVEAAIDLLLDQQFPGLHLGALLARAASQRNPAIPSLLADCYRDVPGVSRFTIRRLEVEYRAAIGVYGGALALSTGEDDAAVAAGMAVMYGLSPAKSAMCLSRAKVLCQDPQVHYLDALEATALLVAGGPWPE
jgi:hypothetical protein